MTTTITTFSLAELELKARQRALDGVRETIAADWEPDLDGLRATLRLLGFEPAQSARWLRYSLFGPDCYAAFSGKWAAERLDLGALQRDWPEEETLFRIGAQLQALHMAEPTLRLDIDASYWRYPSAHTTVVKRLDRDELVGDGDDHHAFRIALAALWKWLLWQLEADYERRTSDEALMEDIEANGWTFLPDGRMV